MLKNFFITATRNLWRNKGMTFIHILGLALGIATCLLILFFIGHEMNYDRYNKKADQIVRVVFEGKMNGGQIKEAVTMFPVAQTLVKEFPEVREATRLKTGGIRRISYGDKSLREDQLVFVDSNFFRIFTLPLLQGDANTALLAPHTVVITRAVAQKYFGQENPIGKVLQFPDDHQVMTVTGLIEGVPENSHFHFSIFASLSTLPESRETSWMNSNVYTYLLLREGADSKKLEAKLPGIVDKYIGPQLKQEMGVSLSQFRAGGNDVALFLQPLKDIHLHSNLTGELEAPGDIHYIYIFGAVAIFMLLIACINFMNLSTASASRRAKEVGVRKVLGSLRRQLIGQFLAESLLLTGLATLIAGGLFLGAFPFFNQLTGLHLVLKGNISPWIGPALVGFILGTSLLAGAYPAFYLSGFRPIAVLKGVLTGGRKSSGFRSGLVVFQFIISTSLIIGTLVVYRQLSFIRHKQLGYERDQVLVIQDTWWLGNNQATFRQELLQDPRVVSVTTSGYLPAGTSWHNNFLIYADTNSSHLINTLRYEVDDHYISTLGMHLAAGRNFSENFGTDSTGIIINETAAHAFGWDKPANTQAGPGNGKIGPSDDQPAQGLHPAEQALGHLLTRRDAGGIKTYRVIGVVKDFHFTSLHQLITPLVMTRAALSGMMIAKVKTGDISSLLASLNKKWSDFHSQGVFSYSFLDDRFNDTYKTEQNIGRILWIFAGLTIFVACLGLFGLATFTAEQRTKEIGIRKVLGADTAGIVALLSKDFLQLVGLAFLIAAPISWWVMNKWLQDFAYRLPISWWIFALAALLAIFISFLTIGFRAFKAAGANPVNSLRSS